MSYIQSPMGSYVLRALAHNAAVYSHLLQAVPGTSPLWDARPEADRFTLREIVAHVVDFDVVMRERFEHMIREKQPHLSNWDEEEAARHYGLRDPLHDLEHLRQSRATLAAWLEGLSLEEWESTATKDGIGTFSVSQGLAILLGHDSYHLQQVAEWLDRLK